MYLLQAVERLLGQRPDVESLLEVHLVGQQTQEDLEISAPFVRSHGYMPHPETVEMLRTADLLFLPMHNLPPGRRARIVPGKTYEYIATHRPILAAVPAGDARDLLERAGSARLTKPDDVDAMAAAILDAFEHREEGPAPISPGLLASYERRTLTRRLAAVLNGAIAVDSH